MKEGDVLPAEIFKPDAAVPEQKVPEPKPEEEAKTTRNFIIAVVIVILAFIAVFALYKYYAGMDNNPKVTVNGFVFEFYAGLWNTQWQRDGNIYNLRLHYNPKQVEDLELTGNADVRFNQPETYITFDPSEENLSYVALSAAELSLSMTNAFNITPVAACSENKTDACSVRPIINCENNNASVIYLKNQAPTLLEFRGNCLVLQGQDVELLRATERFLYSWYRILR
ncbi:MAG: hypothetical protein V1702_06330 [Candidatus Woesearchaeota archaeon]